MAEGSGLVIDGVVAGYGGTTVLDGVSLALADGETVALLGRNGVGKTTLLATIMGHTDLRAGAIRFGGTEIGHLPAHRRGGLGLGWVPQERDIFPSLTLEENLTLAPRPGGWTLARVYELFPALAQRRRNWGNQLSGGEQQMLSVGRALMGNPRLLLLDEPLEGLAPVIVDGLMRAIATLRDGGGLGIVLVEQHARLALEFAPRAIVLDRGRIVHDGPSAPLRADPALLAALLAVGGGGEGRTGQRG